MIEGSACRCHICKCLSHRVIDSARKVRHGLLSLARTMICREYFTDFILVLKGLTNKKYA